MSESKAPTPPAPNAQHGQQLPVSGTAVTIGCKLPNGMILEMGKRGDENYKRVQIRGAQTSRVIGGYGLTEVSKAFAEAWFKKFAWLPAVKKGLIFMQDSSASAQAFASDNQSRKTGLERLNPKDAPKGLEIDHAQMEKGKRELEDLKYAMTS